MVQVSKRTELQQFLLRYYQIQWLRVFNRGLYFFIQIFLFMFLTYLPIKITFNYQLQDGIASGNGVQAIIVIIFFLHIFLYLDHKVKKLVENPQIKKKVLFKTYVVKLKWLNLINTQLIYDVLCLLIAIYQLIANEQSAFRILELIYLPKVYKIKMFHDRFLTYIIGTPFYIIYNVFYGLFILIIIVSYVGCLFFEIDRILYNSNYPYPDLLWVQNSAWPTIIEDGFHIQLLYTMYWSLGTASSAAYGNVAAAAPEDIIYNIICLYFQGFLFGFYLSRIHSLPQMLTKKEDQLLQIFEQFEQHKDAIKKSDKNERIEKDLYFKILCSLEYRQYRKKNLNEIQKLLPRDYLIQIKTHVFKSLLDADPLQLWPSSTLQEKLSLKIQQTTTQAGQQVYQYGQIKQNDLIYIKQGDVTTSIVIDSIAFFISLFRSGQFFGVFQFATGFINYPITAVCKNYCNLYRISRNDYKELLQIDEKVKFDQIASNIRSFNCKITQNQSIGLFQSKLNLQKSYSVFLTGQQKCKFVSNLLISRSQKYKNIRNSYERTKFKQSRLFIDKNPSKKDIAIQCDEQDHSLKQIDQVIIL